MMDSYLGKPDLIIGKVVDFNAAADQLYPFDFTAANTELSDEILSDTRLFSDWISHKLSSANCRYGIGGYNEHRTIYARSAHFDTHEEPRRLHLGVDIWGPALTPVYNFYEATVHSFKFNDHFGDYGATIILKYEIGDLVFHALYGHLSLASLDGLEEGQLIPSGSQFAAFGIAEENGHWPPHLHFQLILDLQGLAGDYPGVCRFSKRAGYLKNCPDPELILKHTFK
ncbi:peptidoglycan DD-metalloendopeptidase family protein [Pedobacter metabolipauper]|uniref:Peptidase M23-like protein n=1 Tax=Pedobacter metabolipauper TaxID=425513 RepID=A0A4R6SWF3_9SPHI|nr:peptidoglycan DD-metalloendopeptidase family protein [Pedobacter metabolipauper]TDQ09716.1 peptidase M23-like protein [Pedobacter metabolipauper]